MGDQQEFRSALKESDRLRVRELCAEYKLARDDAAKCVPTKKTLLDMFLENGTAEKRHLHYKQVVQHFKTEIAKLLQRAALRCGPNACTA